MHHPDADRAAALMSGRALPVLALDRLAELLYADRSADRSGDRSGDRSADGAPDSAADRIAGALGRDPRFRIVAAAAPVTDAGGWPPALRARYAAAFRRAGLEPARTVVLLAPGSPGPAAGPRWRGATELLRDTVAGLLGDGAAARSGAESAELARAAAAAAVALSAITAAASKRPTGADRSTTPPPRAQP